MYVTIALVNVSIIIIQCFSSYRYTACGRGVITNAWQANEDSYQLTCKRLRPILSVKAILQVLIYKALYDKSYLESKTTMTTGEWSCLISFTWAPLTCSERGGSEKFKMKIYVSSGIRTHTASVHDRRVSALDRSATLVRYQVEHYSLTVFWNGYVTIPVWNRIWFDTQCKVM